MSKSLKKRFTETMLLSLKPGDDGSAYVVWDTETAGLGVRVSRDKDGTINRTLFLQFRVGRGEAARQVKKKLCHVRELPNYPEGLKTVREQANVTLLEARTRGIDPRDAPKPIPTLAKFVETYLKERGKDYADGGDTARRRLKHAIEAFGAKTLDAITVDDVERHYRDIARRDQKNGGGPAAARTSLVYLSALFSLAQKKGLIAGSPTRHVKREPDVPRDVVLTPEEMDRFVGALDQFASSGPMAQEFADVIRLLVLTGSRKSEVLAMEWSELDLEAGVWTRAAERMKNRRKSEVPLHPDAVAILKDIRARRDAGPKWAKVSPFVFASKVSKLGRLSCIQAPFKKVLAVAEINRDVHVHDLRATFITVALVNGMQPSLLRHLTGHANTIVLDRVYNRLQSVDTLRAGLASIGEAWRIRRD